MPVDWNDVKQKVNEATELTQEWSNRAYEQGNDWINKSGLQDLTLKDVWNAPFDLATRPSASPSAEKYKECKENNGTSGWNEQGVWKCLFPNAAKPPTWYTNYSDFLEARDKQYRKREKELFQWGNPKLISAEDAKGKTIVGQSVSVDTQSDKEGNAVTRKRTTTFYNDGTASQQEDSKNGGWFWN